VKIIDRLPNFRFLNMLMFRYFFIHALCQKFSINQLFQITNSSSCRWKFKDNLLLKFNSTVWKWGLSCDAQTHRHPHTQTQIADGRGVWIPFSSHRFSSLICLSVTNGMQRMQERDRQTDRLSEREWLKDWVKVRRRGKYFSFIFEFAYC